MTTEDFNNKNFELSDKVRVIMNDGTERIIILGNSNLYSTPGHRDYLTGEVTPEREPVIIVQHSFNRPTLPEGEGIPISQVRDVIKIDL